jgi:homogentisate 1,2-dioxygenase
MAYYRSVGNVARKRHTQHRNPDGGLYYEELVGEEGFFSDSSLLYHKRITSQVKSSRPWDLDGDYSTQPNHPLKNRHFKLHDLFAGKEPSEVDAVTGRRMVLGNNDVRIAYAVAGKTSPLYRNSVGDECVYIESGSAVVESMFGALEVGSGDYVIIPRSTIHRYIVNGDGPLRAYCIEANSHVQPARRYLSKFGQLLEHAPYCERDLRGPTETLIRDDEDVDVYVKHRGNGPGGLSGTIITQPHHPFDVVGWDGFLYPYAMNISDFEPITGRVHQPPPAHQIWEANNVIICNFVPRKVDYHPEAVPVPYYHINADSDEVMFYCGGDYEARKGSGIAQGSISLHPSGQQHGPQPGAVERSLGVEFFDELAVMVDTFFPLEIATNAMEAEDPAYESSWTRAPESNPYVGSTGD